MKNILLVVALMSVVAMCGCDEENSDDSPCKGLSEAQCIENERCHISRGYSEEDMGTEMLPAYFIGCNSALLCDNVGMWVYNPDTEEVTCYWSLNTCIPDGWVGTHPEFTPDSPCAHLW